MNKKIILTLLLLLLSVSLISCGQKEKVSDSNKPSNEIENSINKEDTNSKADNDTDLKEDDNVNLDTDIKEDNNVNPDTNTDLKEETNIKQSLTEEEYYKLIKDAKKRQQDYIDSIDDPNIKQSVQTSYAAAVSESSVLYLNYPDDTGTIDAALNRVLSE